MADIMQFPDTVDEFMEQYKVVDTDHVYTNGTELVPIFRMKQWFEHVKTADVRENVRGEWIPINGAHQWRCSNCGEYISGDADCTPYINNYCWNCGTDMRERKTDETD